MNTLPTGVHIITLLPLCAISISDDTFIIPLLISSKKAPLHSLFGYDILSTMNKKEILGMVLVPNQFYNGVRFIRELGIKQYNCGTIARMIECECPSCGKLYQVSLASILTPTNHRCRECCNASHRTIPKQKGNDIDLCLGNEYGWLSYIGEAGYKHYECYDDRLVRCRCRCGEEIIISAITLSKPRFHACRSCLNERMKLKKGNIRLQFPRLWAIYKGMIYRCHCVKPTSAIYRNYRGRGIIVCDEWLHSFSAFVEWSLQNGYSSRLSIDRINVNGNYEPGNCRWATAQQQSNNQRARRCTIMERINNEIIDLKSASEKYHIPYARMLERRRRGYKGDALIVDRIKTCKGGVFSHV